MQLLVDIGAIPGSTKECLLEYLQELEASHKSTQASLKRIPFATARKFLLMHEQRQMALIKAVKSVLNPRTQHGTFVNSLPDTNKMLETCYPDIDMNGPESNGAEDADTDEEDAQQSPSHGDSSPSPTPTIEHSGIQYVRSTTLA